MAGKMCTGVSTDKGFQLKESKAFCEGMAHRAKGTASNFPITDNPEDGVGSSAEAAWDAGWTVADDASAVFTLTGSIDNTNFVLTGSIDPAASVNVVGVGTLFETELIVGDSIVVTGETRIIDTITDDENLIVTVAFSDNANDTSPEMVGNRNVVGVGTLFETELVVGDSITVSAETREVATITDDTNLTVTVLFTDTANDESPDRVRAAAMTKSEVGCCGLRGITVSA